MTVSSIRAYIDRFKLSIKIKRLHQVTDISGSGHAFGQGSRAELNYGSLRSDIKINSNVKMLGLLHSQSNGFIFLDEFSKIGERSRILCVNKVVIGMYTAIGNNVTISDNNNHPLNPEDRKFMRQTPSGSKYRGWVYSDNAPIVIGENVWIGENSRVCKGVTIGDNSIVAANTVVTKDVPENCIVAGNPGKIVKKNIDKIPRVFSE